MPRTPDAEMVLVHHDEVVIHQGDLDDVADWLVAIGYPFDFSTTVLPPPWLQRAVEEAWLRKDGLTAEDAEAIPLTVAEEGGWAAQYDGGSGA